MALGQQHGPGQQPPGLQIRSRRVRLGGLPLDLLSLDETVEAVDDAVRRRSRLHIVTLNLDYVALARRDRSFGALLPGFDLVVPDGVPLLWLARLLGHRSTRVNGTDLVVACAELSARSGARIALVGALPPVAQAAAEALEARFPGARVTAVPTPALREPGDGAEVAQAVADAETDILLIGLGAPLQERWALHHLDATGASVAVGVGGSFDILAGVQPRAPLAMQRSGLEWAWRMVHDPRRLVARYLLRDVPAAAALLVAVLRQRASRSAHGRPVQGVAQGVTATDRSTPEDQRRRPA